MIAQELIEDAFYDIGKKAHQQPINGEEFRIAIRKINSIMARKSGLGLGHTEIVNSSDTITTPSFSWEWMSKELALGLSSQYGTLESYMPLTIARNEAYSDVLNAVVYIPPATMTGNVPLGSGNMGPGYCGSGFYDEETDGVLTETQQPIVAE